MRHLKFKPSFFVLVILSAALCFMPGDSTTRASSASPPLTGEAAIARLKEQGLYSSLIEAARAARHGAQPSPAPESSFAINLPFTQLSKQTARDGEANDNYGYSVAATDDTVVIGANLDTVGDNAHQGSAYVFSRSGAGWELQQKLTSNDGGAEDRFGHSVAISGDTIVIGAPYDSAGTSNYQGSAYVFTRSNGVWSFQKKLTAHDGAAYDQFGYSVAISGGTVVAGAFSDDIGAKADQGSAYVFVSSGGGWIFQQKLTANDGEANDQFGGAVAIDAGSIIAGAVLDDLGTSQDAGSAYVFIRSGAVWTQQQKLSGLNSVGSATSDLFGAAVAISGDTVIIGAPLFNTFGRSNQGLVVVYVRSGDGWSYQGYLAANDGEAEDRFGNSVAINGDTALIGAHFDDIGLAGGLNPDQGSAYLFTRSGALWGARQKFTAQGGAVREMFGQAVALSGDVTIVGAPHARVGENESQGAVYVFGCGHAAQQKLTGLNSYPFNSFGFVVAIDGDTAVVGAPNDDVGTSAKQGSAYVFVRNGAGWTQSAQLFAHDGETYDHFGYCVAVSGDTIAIGAPFKAINGKSHQGAVYFFVRSGGTWKLDAHPSGLAEDDYFGWSVATNGSLIAVGASNDDVGGNTNQGSVSIFTRSGASWALEKTLTANDGAAFDYFGRSVALSGDRLLVGAPGPNDGERSKGAAYVFERSSSQSQPWAQRAKLLASDGEYLDHFGNSVAISGNTALVSAPGKVIHNPLRRQAAYVFVASNAHGENWPQQARLILGEGYPYGSLSVALSGNTAVVGTSTEYVDGRLNQGMARVFTRSGAVWTPQQQIVAGDGEAGDQFGVSVAIGGDTILAGAVQGGGENQGAVYVSKKSCGSSLAPVTSVSAASFAGANGLAPESIVAAFGVNLATSAQSANSLPLPTTLAGVSVKIKDSLGAERLAPLFFISPGQINFVIPAGASAGQATLTVINAGAPVAAGEILIAGVAPGLFSANSSGQGVANAFAFRVKANGSQSLEPVARFDPSQNGFVPIPIDLGSTNDQVFLVLYGTGLRYRSSLSAVNCSIGGVSSEVLFAGAAPGFTGLDQVNVRLPRSLAGRGEVDVALVVDGKAANKTRVSIR